MSAVKLLEYPTEKDWLEVKRRALVTAGLTPKNAPDVAWKHAILEARHSPIRYLRFSFYIECPYWVSVHLCRHVHAQPYVRSQRNDRQSDYDRNAARQDEPVSMILDVNAEEQLKAQGFEVINPAKINAMLPRSMAYGQYMDMSRLMLCFCDCVFMLNGWENSRGAKQEFAWSVLGEKKIYFEKDGLPEVTNDD